MQSRQSKNRRGLQLCGGVSVSETIGRKQSDHGVDMHEIGAHHFNVAPHLGSAESRSAFGPICAGLQNNCSVYVQDSHFRATMLSSCKAPLSGHARRKSAGAGVRGRRDRPPIGIARIARERRRRCERWCVAFHNEFHSLIATAVRARICVRVLFDLFEKLKRNHQKAFFTKRIARQVFAVSTIRHVLFASHFTCSHLKKSNLQRPKKNLRMCVSALLRSIVPDF